jgi:hypothetical protein
MENSPPGIHTIPSGAVAECGAAFSTVGRNPRTAGVAIGGDVDADLERITVTVSAAVPATAATATHLLVVLTRRPADTGGVDFRCGLLISLVRSSVAR